jgi:Fe-S cluster biogenesis protein NfuA
MIANHSEILSKVENSLDKIRPFLEKDGGNIQVLGLNELGELRLEFLGTCSECSMSNLTFKNGIEENIKKDVPEIKKVIATNLSKN